jgi:AraC-like DNA-binding protein
MRDVSATVEAFSPIRVSSVDAREASHERVIFASADVLLGEFRCPTSAADFAIAGKIRNHVIAFPQSAVWIERERERPFVADPSVATLYTPGQAYRRRAISRMGDYTDWIAVSGAIARAMVTQIEPGDAERDDAFVHSHAPVGGRLYFEQRRLFSYVASKRADPAVIEEAALSIVAAVIETPYAAAANLPHRRVAVHPRARVRQREIFEEAKAVVIANLEQNLALGQIAARVNVSVHRLCHAFRAGAGIPLYAFRRAVRVRAALGDLPGYRGNLSVLARRYGFSSHPHFSTAFVREFGVSPSVADRAVGDASLSLLDIPQSAHAVPATPLSDTRRRSR